MHGFTDKTTAINEMWQTDFTYFKVNRPLGDARIAWKFCTTMRAEDVTGTIELALTASGCDQAVVRHMPRLLSDQAIEGAIGSSPMARGACYISGDLAMWLGDQKMDHVRGAPFHLSPDRRCMHLREGANPRQDPSHGLQANHCRPVERWHQTMKNRVLLENYYLPGDLERQIGAFVDYYNNQ